MKDQKLTPSYLRRLTKMEKAMEQTLATNPNYRKVEDARQSIEERERWITNMLPFVKHNIKLGLSHAPDTRLL